MRGVGYIEAKMQKAREDTYYSRVRPEILESLLRYACLGIPTGGFLDAVLSNNLSEALARADQGNLLVLKEIVMFIYMELPAPCWGSPEKVDAWLKQFEVDKREDG